MNPGSLSSIRRIQTGRLDSCPPCLLAFYFCKEHGMMGDRPGTWHSACGKALPRRQLKHVSEWRRNSAAPWLQDPVRQLSQEGVVDVKAVAYVFLRLLHCRTVVCFTMSRAMSISRPRHETALQEPWKRPCEAFLASGARAPVSS